MYRLAGVALLISCNAWVRPAPPPPTDRSPELQRRAVVRIESRCDPFGDGALTKSKVGTGVMVSEWQVLTAIHVVDCQSSIPVIKVYNEDGQMWLFMPEHEWVYRWLPERDGVARIQMNSADTLRPRLAPPGTSTDHGPAMDDPVYMQTVDSEKLFSATGWSYGGPRFGGRVYTYQPLGLSDPSEAGDSGSGGYDIDGALVGIHLGHMPDGRSYGALIQPGMVP